MRTIALLALGSFLTIPAVPAPKEPAGPKPPLEASETVWFFGMIPKDATVCHHYALTNPHEDTVTIVELVADCDCTAVPKTPITIPPGETYLLPVVFNTRTYYGETNRDIKIITDYDPNPEMAVYFLSFAARRPNTVNILPRVTAFIPGKDIQTFTIENLSDEKTRITVYLDHDSSLMVSEPVFTLKAKEKRTFTVSPKWDRVPTGSTFRSLVVEVAREQTFQTTIPIKLNKY